MIKELKEFKDYGIQFTDEELAELGIEKNQKFSVKYMEEGVLLEPFVKIDIDLSEFSREILEMIVRKSAEEDVSVNQVISDILKKYIDNTKGDNDGSI